MILHLLARVYRHVSCVKVLIIALLSVQPAFAQTSLLSFEWIQDFPSDTLSVTPTSINANGDFAGSFLEPRALFYGESIGFAYTDDTLIDVRPGLFQIVVTGINDSGQVSGKYNTGSEDRGFFGNPHNVSIVDRGKLTQLADINNDGVTVGYSRDNSNSVFQFRHPGDTFAQFVTTSTSQLAINDSAVVAGIESTSASVFIDRDGQTTNLGLPISSAIFGSIGDINNSDQIVGSVFTSASNLVSFVYDPDSGFRTLSPLTGHANADAAANDNAGHVVGSSSDADFDNHTAVVWINDQAIALKDLVGSSLLDGGSLISANDIGENGWIVGTGSYQGSNTSPWRAQLSFGPEGWINASGGRYDNDANWSTGTPPTSEQMALFSLPETFTVEFPNAIANHLTRIEKGNVTFQLDNTVYTTNRFVVQGEGTAMPSLQISANRPTASPRGVVTKEMLVGRNATFTTSDFDQVLQGSPDRPLLIVTEKVLIEDGGTLKTLSLSIAGYGPAMEHPWPRCKMLARS